MSKTTVGQGGVFIGRDNTGSVETNVHVTTQNLSSGDVSEIVSHLGEIIRAAKASPAADFAPEKIAELEKAKKELEADDKASAGSTLKSIGSWLLDFAGKVGQTLAAAAIKAKLGI